MLLIQIITLLAIGIALWGSAIGARRFRDVDPFGLALALAILAGALYTGIF